ncbi:MAG: hydroxyacid dehydrogenase [Sulfolobales archaeon]|nr:hydroxyacid dehydrogenase [Sulfolobales archaeon]MCX8186827.1 hydroxyacid dehydrogenase [Sulfolobales archaeon]MDW7969829.1 hydroxyacid dehydrogenase [Sulfolobales archaeon]
MSKWVVSIVTMKDAPILQEAVEKLKEVGEVRYVWSKGWFADEDVLKGVAGSDAILVRRGRVDKSVMDVCPNLKIVSIYGVGIDRVDVEEATRRGVLVTNGRGSNSTAVAELTIGLTIMALRNLYQLVDKMRVGSWEEANKYATGYEVCGKTVGLVGIGNIGSRVAKILKAMEARVIAYDPYVSAEKAKEWGVELVDLDTLVKESDIISIHAMLTKETQHLINEDKLRKMKKSAIIVNTARGGIIDTEALVKALKEGWIAGAALDVTDPEPIPPNHPLLKLPNVIITPHVGGGTVESANRMSFMAVEEIIRAYRGLPPMNPVNPEVLKNK